MAETIYKHCSGCNLDKSLTEFAKRTASPDGLQPKCKSCQLEYRKRNRIRYRNHSRKRYACKQEEIKEYNRYYRKENADKRLEYNRKFREENPELIRQWARDRYHEKEKDRLKELRQTDPDKAYRANRKWAANNPWYIASKCSSRRRKIKLATPAWADKKAIVEIYKKSHFMSLGDDKYHVDHIIPIVSDVVCGLHCEDNLQIIPAYDNISKGNTLLG